MRLGDALEFTAPEASLGSFLVFPLKLSESLKLRILAGDPSVGILDLTSAVERRQGDASLPRRFVLSILILVIEPMGPVPNKSLFSLFRYR